ncbi:MAG TPA: Ig-like domain-containing protein, partial [Gemmatimonadaceae bacterium]
NVTRDVSAVVVTPVNPTVLAGSTQQLNAAVTADPGVSTALTWTSSNINVATVSATGLVTGVGQGQATITARSVASPGVSGVSDVTVIAVSTVTVAPDAATINVGSQVTLGATVLPPTAPQAVDWSSANPAIASVNPTTGVVTGVSRGTTTITATSQANSMAKGSAAITVRGIISIGIAPGIDSVRVGGLKAFLAAITADPGVSNLATYSSLNPAIATVNPTTGVATGVSLGTTTIRATAQADMTKVANATLKVLSPCDLPIIMSIGQTINAAVNATSCSSGDINLEHEHIAYSLGGNTSFVSTATAPFTYHFAPLVTNKGYWYAAFVAAGPNTWRVFASAGQYRSFISNTALGQFGAISWATAVSIGGFCPGAAITTTNVNTGPIPFTAACPVITPSGAPAGTYYGLVMYLLPPLEVGDFISITATTSGFAPRIVLIDNETATQYQAVGAGNTVTLNHTITNGAYHYMIITTAAPGFAGTVTTTISGPAARVMTDNAAVRGAPGGMPIPP